jgi:glutamate 5-kinase
MKLSDQDSRLAGFNPQKIVIKIGSSILTTAEGQLDIAQIESFAASIARITDEGRRVIIVSSGAIRAGISEMGLKDRPQSIPEHQALAAIGQSRLMHHYGRCFEKHKKKIAQILLTREDMDDRRRYLNIRYTLEKLLEMGVIPIINENDTTTIDELKFGDNDVLSAIVAAKMNAELLIMLTNVSGLSERPPSRSRPAKIIPRVERITPEIEAMASRDVSKYGSGGMSSKLEAAKRATYAGVYAVVTYGKQHGIIDAILHGDFEGTVFLADTTTRLSSRDRWIIYGKSTSNCRLVIDDGARKALVVGNKSLLPVGVVAVSGQFQAGDVVEIYDQQNRLVAKGLVNYSASAVDKIKGLQSHEIVRVLGLKDYDEVVHRDNLVLLINH